MSAARAAPYLVRDASDEELMRRVQDDDAGAFEEMYDRHSARAFRIARSMCPGAGAAEEAVQEGFISIWRSRGSYQARLGAPSAWMMTVVRNRTVDLARRTAVHERRRTGSGPMERMAAPGNLVTDTIVGDDAQHLRKLLTRLPAAQREVIALAYYGELSYTEIADHLGIPPGTVKGRMRLGLLKLNDQLAPARSA